MHCSRASCSSSAAECPFRRRWSESAGSRPSTRRPCTSGSGRASRGRTLRAHPGARAPVRDPGDADAGDDPSGLPRRLLAADRRDPRRAQSLVERTHRQADPQRARAAGKRLRAFLAGRPRRWKEIQERFGREDALAAAQYVDLVRVPPSGTWEQRRADLYGLAEEWIGPDEADEQKASTCRPSLPRRLRSRDPGRGCRLRDGLDQACARRPRRDGAPPLPRRGRQGARRPAARAARIPTRPRRRASCRSGTRHSSSTPGVRRSSRRSIAPRSSTSRRRTRSTRSSSTARSRVPGGTTAIGSGSNRSGASRTRRAGARRGGRTACRVPPLGR